MHASNANAYKRIHVVMSCSVGNDHGFVTPSSSAKKKTWSSR